MRYTRFFVLLLGLVLMSCQTDGNGFDPQGIRELTLLGGSGHPGRLCRVDVPRGTVHWMPIEVGGYIKAIEVAEDRVYVIVLDGSETDSPNNGLFQIDDEGKATRILLKGEPTDSSVVAITSGKNRLYALTEYSIFEIQDRGTAIRHLGDAQPDYYSGSFTCVADSLAYKSRGEKLATFDIETTETIYSTPKKYSRKGIFQGFIVGEVGDQLLLSKYRESYCWLGAAQDLRSERILKLAKKNKVQGLKEFGDTVFMWRNIEYPNPELRILSGDSGVVTTVKGVNILDLCLAPLGFRPPLEEATN